MHHPSSAARRAACALLATSLGLLGLTIASPADATSSVSTRRISGANRYATARDIATDTVMGTPTGAIVATGENYPDALAAAALAGAAGPAPIVLTASNAYSPEAKAALAALKAKGVSAVTVVGGTLAVSAAVQTAIAADGFTVTRTFGNDRYATAAAIAVAANGKQPGGIGSVGGLKTAIFATGENFPDALAGGPMAQRADLPILLVTRDAIPQATKDAIASLAVKNAIILGGTSVVSSAVQTQLGTLTADTSIDRLAGANRNATAAAIADFAIGTLNFPAGTAVLATGLNFPDALAAGVLAGVAGGPIVLTASLPAESQQLLDRYSSTISTIIAAGGSSVISDADIAAAKAAAEIVSNDTNVTAAPELQRVQAAGTDSGTGGVVLRYIFDETMSSTSIVAANFKAWTATGEVGTGSAAALDATNALAILVSFPLSSTAVVNEATAYAVAAGAARDTTSTPNPEGLVAAAAGQSFAAGSTRAPDLQSATPVSGQTEVYDFVFDTPVTAASSGGFQMVDTDGLVRTSSAAALQDVVSGASTTVRVTFGAPATSQSGNRAVATAGAVTADTTRGQTASTLQTVTVSGRTAGTDSPDLVSVSLNTTNGNDATFTFDESIETLTGGTAQGSPGAFHLVYRNGTIATGTSAERTSATGAVVTFSASPNNAVNELVVGAYVSGSAVARLGSTTTTKPNRPHWLGITRSFAAGEYIGPRVTSATKSTTTSGSTVTGFKITYVFDQQISATLSQGGAPNGFYVVGADGVRTQIPSSYCSRAADVLLTTVICDSSVATDTTSASALAMNGAKVATVAAATVTATKVRTVGGATWTASTVNREAATSL